MITLVLSSPTLCAIASRSLRWAKSSWSRARWRCRTSLGVARPAPGCAGTTSRDAGSRPSTTFPRCRPDERRPIPARLLTPPESALGDRGVARGDSPTPTGQARAEIEHIISTRTRLEPEVDDSSSPGRDAPARRSARSGMGSGRRAVMAADARRPRAGHPSRSRSLAQGGLTGLFDDLAPLITLAEPELHIECRGSTQHGLSTVEGCCCGRLRSSGPCGGRSRRAAAAELVYPARGVASLLFSEPQRYTGPSQPSSVRREPRS